MSPRQSLSASLHAASVSDIISVLDVPSVMSVSLVVRGVLRLPLMCEKGA